MPAGSAELLTFSPGAAAPTTTIVGGLSGKCLSVTGGSTADGAAADIFTCNGSAQPELDVRAGGTIVGGLSGKCLTVTGGVDGQLRRRQHLHLHRRRRPAVDRAGAGGTIVGVPSGKCLSVLGASTTNGATAEIYTCNGSASEIWSQS